SPEPGRTGGMADRVREVLAEHLGRPAPQIPSDVGFYELGLNSVDVLKATERLEQLVGATLYPTLLFEHTTVDAVAAHLVAEHGEFDAATVDTAGGPASSDRKSTRLNSSHVKISY